MASNLDGVGVLQEKLILFITELSMHLAGESEPLKVWQELRSCSPSTALANKVSGHVNDNIRELPAEHGALD